MRKTMMAPFLAEERPRDRFSGFMRAVRVALVRDLHVQESTVGPLWYCGTDQTIEYTDAMTGALRRFRVLPSPLTAPTLVRVR